MLLKEKTLESLLNQKNNRNQPFNTGVNWIFSRNSVNLKIYFIQAQRFNYTIKEEIPGPGTYDEHPKIDWSKRSYNVAFAEI